MMRILAVDPGSEQSGYVLWDSDSWQVLRHDIVANTLLLSRLRLWGPGWRKHHLVIEQMRSYGSVVGRTVFQAVFWSGRFAEAHLLQPDMDDFHLIQRQLVFRSLLARPTGTDAMVRRAVMDLYEERFAGHLGGGKRPVIGIKKDKGPLYGLKEDEWQALGLALTWAREQYDTRAPEQDGQDDG